MKTLYFKDVPKQPYGIAIIETVLNSASPTELHTHDFCELFFIKKGEMLHTINSESFLMRRGDFRLIHSTDIHCFQKVSRETASLVNISFPTDFYEHLKTPAGFAEKEPKLSCQGSLSATQMLIVEELLDLLLRVELLPEELPEHKKSLVFSLLQTILLSQTISDSQIHTDIPPWLCQTVDALKRPEIMREGIQGLVRVSGRSQEHLTRQLRKYYHQTPSQIINKIRIDRAQELLSATNLPILEISMRVGYESVSYFNRLFMQQVGMSPRDYRNSLQNFI